MGEGTRESLRDYYRKQIHKVIEKNPEALVDLFVDQHMALEALTKAFKEQQAINHGLRLKSYQSAWRKTATTLTSRRLPTIRIQSRKRRHSPPAREAGGSLEVRKVTRDIVFSRRTIRIIRLRCNRMLWMR